MAHKKGVGSSRNGRDSNPKYLGVKKYGGSEYEPATSWSGSAAPAFTRAATSVEATTTRYSRSPTGWYSTLTSEAAGRP